MPVKRLDTGDPLLAYSRQQVAQIYMRANLTARQFSFATRTEIQKRDPHWTASDIYDSLSGSRDSRRCLNYLSTASTSTNSTSCMRLR